MEVHQIEQYLKYCTIIYPELEIWIYSNLSNFIYKEYKKEKQFHILLNKDRRTFYEQCLLFISQCNKNKIKRISIPQSYLGFLKLKAQFENSTEKLEKILLFKNNFYWVKLNKKEDFYREASQMNNCLAAKHKDSSRQYYSLKNQFNKSIVNIAVEDNKIIECKEINNEDLSLVNKEFVILFANKNRFNHTISLPLVKKWYFQIFTHMRLK